MKLNYILFTFITGFILFFALVFSIKSAHLVYAANPSANLDQCANDPAPSPSNDGCSSSSTDWVNGNLGASKSSYFEGDSIPYRLVFDNLSLASHTVTIEWDTTKSSKHATDYLTSFNRTVTTANPCLGVSGCSSFSTFAIPADPQVTGAGVTPVSGNFTLYGGTITAVSAYSYPAGSGFTGDKSARLSITFTASVANPVLAWGGHIATRSDWGMNNSAISISGSPYHTRLIDLDGSGGNQDRSLSADAVIFPGSLTIVKDATPNGSTSFSFTASPSPLSGFSLVDDGTSANTHVFSNIIDFKAYSVNETPIPSGWGFDSLSCSVTSPNGGAYTSSGAIVSVDLHEGENWTCTYLNSLRTGTLTVIKHVINDNGGTATASNFTLHVTNGGTDVTGSPAAGSETGTIYTLPAGTYNVSENTPVTGYTNVTTDGNNGNCDASGNVTLAAGENKTCTITNDDNAAHLNVIKHVINNNGGNALATDFTMHINGVSVSDSSMSFAGVESPGVTKTLTSIGSYNVSESGPSGYASSSSSDCSGTIALGESKTCTITNNDVAPQLTVIKHVINDNGGTNLAGDFTMNVAGSNVSTPTFAGNESGTLVTLDAGSYGVGESGPGGYTESDSTDCSGTISVGQSKTCTVTNNDQAAHIIVIKHVINDNGGTATSSAFTMHISGTAGSANFPGVESPGVDTIVNAGTFSVTEDAVTGYASSQSGDCSGTIANGQTKTCTITNNDVAPQLTVIKHVINNDGGSAVASDFTMHITGTNVQPAASFPGAESPGTTVTLNPGTYSIGENGLSGYTESDSTDCNGTIALGETKTCTITNDDQAAHLIVIKHVINDNGGTAVASAFTMNIGGVLVADGSSSFAGIESPGVNKTLSSVGSYNITESGPSGYADSYSSDCQGSIALGQTKTCTITNNDQAPSLTLVKVVINDNGGTAVAGDWTLTASGPTGIAGTGPTVGSGTTFSAGTYDLSESGPSGYSAGNGWVCVGGNQSDGDTVSLGLGDSAICTITNNDIQPLLHVIKHVINDNGGSAVASDFSISFPTGNNPDPSVFPGDELGTDIAINAGSYSVGEFTFTAGYASSFSSDCSGTIAVGEIKTCTVTNDDLAPTITLNKVVENLHGGTAVPGNFTLKIDGSGVTQGIAHNVSANTPHAIDEASLTGYEFVNIGGDPECPSVLGGTATIAPGVNITCTITNRDIAPQLTVIKHVINDNGGTNVAGDFTMNVTGTNVSNPSFTGTEAGTLVTLDAGLYGVGETGPSGYAESASSDCSGTINIGEAKTCTITNDDIAPTLTIIKLLNPTSDSGLFNLQIDGTTAGTGANVGDGGTTGAVPVNAGSHTVGEIAGINTSLNNYNAVISGSCAANGSINLSLAQNATCTITNTRYGSITIVKDAQPNDEQDFNFLATGTGVNNFTLDDDNGVDSTYSNSVTFNTLLPGSFSFNESLPNSFWTLAGVTCIDADSQNPFAGVNVTSTGVSFSLNAGNHVQCTFVNTKQSPTRTQGFWQTHTSFTSNIFSLYFASGMQIGSGSHKGVITNIQSAGQSQLYGAYYANIAQKSTGKGKTAQRSDIDKARMQLLQQLVTAKLNCAAFSCATSIQNMLSAADNAYANGPTSLILSYVNLLDAFNQSGDTLIIPNLGTATPKTSQSLANIPFWDAP